MQFKSLRVLAAALALGSASLHAQNVQVTDAWARATVPNQKATGAFMKLTSPDGTRLVDASSPVAGITEVHEMKMENGVMKMRAAPELALPAGQAVELKPGGYHVMLMDLKTALKPDSTVPLTLVFRNARGVESRQQVQVPVRTGPGGAAHAPAAKH